MKKKNRGQKKNIAIPNSTKRNLRDRRQLQCELMDYEYTVYSGNMTNTHRKNTNDFLNKKKKEKRNVYYVPCVANCSFYPFPSVVQTFVSIVDVNLIHWLLGGNVYGWIYTRPF